MEDYHSKPHTNRSASSTHGLYENENAGEQVKTEYEQMCVKWLAFLTLFCSCERKKPYALIWFELIWLVLKAQLVMIINTHLEEKVCIIPGCFSIPKVMWESLLTHSLKR